MSDINSTIQESVEELTRRDDRHMAAAANALPAILDRLAAAVARTEQAERELATLRIGCQAALVDWRAELFSTEQPVSSGQEVNRGAAMAYRAAISLLQKVVDGTVTDLDFDEAEYADMMAGGSADGEATS